MSQGIEPHIDWTANPKPQGRRVASGPAGRPDPQLPAASGKRSVMDTLLGKNNLTASDISGNDPYNTTGRFFRR